MEPLAEPRRVVIERNCVFGWYYVGCGDDRFIDTRDPKKAARLALAHIGIEYPDVSALQQQIADLKADIEALARARRDAKARVRKLEGCERVVKALCGRTSYGRNAIWLRRLAGWPAPRYAEGLLAAADALDALAAGRGEPEPEPEVTKYERVMAALPTPAACRIWSKAVEKKNMPYLAGMLRRLAEALESEAPAPEPPSPEARVVEAARVKWGDVTVCPTCGQPLPAAVDALPPDEEGS